MLIKRNSYARGAVAALALTLGGGVTSALAASAASCGNIDDGTDGQVRPALCDRTPPIDDTPILLPRPAPCSIAWNGDWAWWRCSPVGIGPIVRPPLPPCTAANLEAWAQSCYPIEELL